MTEVKTYTEQQILLHRLACSGKRRRIAQSLKPGTFKYLDHQVSYFVGAITALNLGPEPKINEMVVFLLSTGRDAEKEFIYNDLLEDYPL